MKLSKLDITHSLPLNSVTYLGITSFFLENTILRVSPSLSALYWIDSISL